MSSRRVLERIVDGKYSRSDFFAMKSIGKDKDSSGELKKQLSNHWFNIVEEDLPDVDLNHVLEGIHHQIEHERKPLRNSRFITIFQRVAAILIVPLLLGYFALFYFHGRQSPAETAMAEIQCPPGVRTHFVLPDGSSGFLNSGSTLEYPIPFGDQRMVRLRGEGYFDISPDEERPFIVESPHLYTRVLGTQFNITAYEDENREEIILKEGSVEILSPSGKRLASLKPNQKLDVDISTGQLNTSDVRAEQYMLWTEGKLVFRNESMEQVTKRLGRWFNVEIEIRDSELLDYALWATFTNEPLEEVMKLLSLTAPIRFKEQERGKTTGNVYLPRKVIFCLDKSRAEAFKL